MTLEHAILTAAGKVDELTQLRDKDQWSYEEAGGNTELEFQKFVLSVLRSFIKIEHEHPLTPREMKSMDMEYVIVYDDTGEYFGVVSPEVDAVRLSGSSFGWWDMKNYATDWLAYRYSVIPDIVPARIEVPADATRAYEASMAYLDSLEGCLAGLTDSLNDLRRIGKAFQCITGV